MNITYLFWHIRYHWLDTINLWQHWKSLGLFPEFLPSDHLFHHTRDWHNVLSSVLLTQQQFSSLLATASQHALTLLRNNVSFSSQSSIVENDQSPASIEFLSPLFHLKTSSYADMNLFLNHLSLWYFGMSVICDQVLILHSIWWQTSSDIVWWWTIS